MEHEIPTNLKTAVILAPDEDGTVPVFGIPAVRRLALLALQLGLTRIFVIGRVEPLRPILSDLLVPDAFCQVEDPEHLIAAVQSLPFPEEARILVLKANHVIDPFSLAQMMKAADRPNLLYKEENDKKWDEEIYMTSPAGLVSVLHSLWLPDASKFKIIEKALSLETTSGVAHLVGKGENGVKIAEAELTSALSPQTAAGDGFLARHVDRPISRFLSERLAHTGVTPNQITLAGVAIGLGGAFFLSRPEYWSQLAGSLLFLICVVVDGVDGEVARLKLQETAFGHYLDIISDNIVHIAIFVGIALGLSRETGDLRYFYALWVLLGGFGFCAVVVYFCILRRSADELEQSSQATRLLALLTNRDFAYLIVVFALIHRLNWFLIGAAAGTYLFAALLGGLSLWERQTIHIKGE